MREINFRAWNVATKTMIDLKKITPLALNMDTDGLFIPFSDGLPLMQFTGLHDKNGTEIYEGDILSTVIMPPVEPFIVRWDPLFACFYCENPIARISPTEWRKREIIGNIYENPELLQELK